MTTDMRVAISAILLPNTSDGLKRSHAYTLTFIRKKKKTEQRGDAVKDESIEIGWGSTLEYTNLD